MPKLKDRPPKYCKMNGQAVVYYRGKSHYLGRHGTPESKTAYARFIAEIQANPAFFPKNEEAHVTVRGQGYRKGNSSSLTVAAFPCNAPSILLSEKQEQRHRVRTEFVENAIFLTVKHSLVCRPFLLSSFDFSLRPRSGWLGARKSMSFVLSGCTDKPYFSNRFEITFSTRSASSHLDFFPIQPYTMGR